LFYHNYLWHPRIRKYICIHYRCPFISKHHHSIELFCNPCTVQCFCGQSRFRCHWNRLSCMLGLDIFNVDISETGETFVAQREDRVIIVHKRLNPSGFYSSANHFSAIWPTMGAWKWTKLLYEALRYAYKPIPSWMKIMTNVHGLLTQNGNWATERRIRRKIKGVVKRADW